MKFYFVLVASCVCLCGESWGDELSKIFPTHSSVVKSFEEIIGEGKPVKENNDGYRVVPVLYKVGGGVKLTVKF